MNRSFFFKILRIAVAAGLIIYLILRIGTEPLRLALSSNRPIFLLLLASLLLLDALLRSINWRILLKTRGHVPSVSAMLFNYMAGAFFGSFVPSSLGTDIARAVLVSRRNSIAAADSALAMIALNLMGLLALSLIGLASAPLLLRFQCDPRLPVLIIAVCLAYVALFPFLLSGWTLSRKRHCSGLAGRVAAKLAEFSSALAAFKQKPAAMTTALLISFLNQAIGIVVVYAAARALDVGVPLLFLAPIVPVVALCRLVPVSIAGFGGEQAVFVLLFSFAGISEAQAFLISLIVSFANLTLALAGGCLYIFDSARRSTATDKP